MNPTELNALFSAKEQTPLERERLDAARAAKGTPAIAQAGSPSAAAAKGARTQATRDSR